MITISEWYSITQLAIKADIPEPTVRRYLTKFKPYFVSKGGNRAKRYDDSAVVILKRIKQLFDAGYETTGVADALRQEFPVIISDEKNDIAGEKPNVATLATAEDMAEIKQALAEQKEFNKLLLQRLSDQERYIKEALENRDQLLLEKTDHKEEIEDTEEVPASIQETQETKKGFFQRFFKK